jgi:phosphoglycolate phosphatase
MKHYAHVIWDWNGTLLDDVTLCVEVMNRMLRERGMAELDTVRYRQIFGFPVKAYYEVLGFDFAAEPFEKLAVEYCMEYDSRVTECRLHWEATAALDAISGGGVTQYLLSSHEHQSLREALYSFQVAGYFKEVVGQSDRHATGKIDSGRDLIRRLGLDPSLTVLVGDTAHDYEVASALETACILVANGHHARERLEAAHDDVVDSIGELVARAA